MPTTAQPQCVRADDPAHFRMSFGMMLAFPGREDRLYGPPGASALGRLDMVVEASYAVISAGRIRFCTKRSVRSLNTAYDGVLSILNVNRCFFQADQRTVPSTVPKSRHKAYPGHICVQTLQNGSIQHIMDSRKGLPLQQYRTTRDNHADRAGYPLPKREVVRVQRVTSFRKGIYMARKVSE